MEHEYLAAYHDATDEPVSEVLDLDEGVESTSIDEWRRLIWNEIEDFAVSSVLTRLRRTALISLTNISSTEEIGGTCGFDKSEDKL